MESCLQSVSIFLSDPVGVKGDLKDITKDSATDDILTGDNNLDKVPLHDCKKKKSFFCPLFIFSAHLQLPTLPVNMYFLTIRNI